MPSNERKNARKAKKRRNEIKTKRIIWVIIIVVAAVLAVMKAAEVDYSALKSRYLQPQPLRVTSKLQ